MEGNPSLSQRLLKSPHHRNLRQELSTDALFHLLNSVASMTEEICPFASITAFRTESFGRSISCPLTTIITYPSSSKESVRSRNHTDSFLCKEFSICLRKVAPRSSPSSLSSSFLSRVSYIFHIRLHLF